MVSILGTVGASDTDERIFYNTGSPFDFVTGEFLPSIDGGYINNGGLTYTNAAQGRQEMFKSTSMDAKIIGVMARYPHVELITKDTEESKKKARMLRMNDTDTEIDPARMVLYGNEMGSEEFIELIKTIRATKLKQAKDLTVETPFIDPKTGKARRILIPTIVYIDSWSKFRPNPVMESLNKYEASDSALNTIHMFEGKTKNNWVSLFPSWGAQANILFCLTAQIGDTIQMDRYAPTNKVLPNMRATDKILSVGKDFSFMMSTLLQVTKAEPALNNDRNGPLYPEADKLTAANEWVRVHSSTVRCKNNGSGMPMSELLSKANGPNNALTCYDYMRDNKYYGLPGNMQHHTVALYPDGPTVGRTTVRAKLDTDYKLRRAVEISANLLYIQSNWTVNKDAHLFMMRPEDLLDKLLSSGYAMSEILESRGYWTYNKQDPRQYLSLLDILYIAGGMYKPKWLQVKSVDKK